MGKKGTKKLRITALFMALPDSLRIDLRDDTDRTGDNRRLGLGEGLIHVLGTVRQPADEDS